MVQISLFSDADTKINNAGRKTERNIRDKALNLKGGLPKNLKYCCVYNIATNDDEISCQIKNMQERQTGVRVAPCVEKCCTNSCIYYTQNKIKGVTHDNNQ